MSEQDTAGGGRDDEAARRARAREHIARGEHGAAWAALHPLWRNLSAHDDRTPGCLCGACLKPEVGALEHQGMRFERRFGAACEKVLWFWLPTSLTGRQDEIVARVDADLAARYGAQNEDDEDYDDEDGDDE
ncbi:MAG: hypothetical protein JNK72_07630 [Myxococcales bacterium]|nr:hypothetical protein [Myxococcales bacterium]